ncbi:MAG: type II toxin-antitoxin system HicB family antitoxin [Candidatus Woesearchaeota archaeon]|nr:MAG: type II toxin-antitoxin system HicB family antitoxin [Candidatus Woesearchaeota archaeon]
MRSFTAIIKKGEEQFIALCPELEVVSQSYTVEESLANLKEAVELYLEEMILAEEFPPVDGIVTFEVKHDEASQNV